MLKKILAEFEQSSEPLCVEDLSQKLNVDSNALEGMLQVLVRKGRLIEIDLTENNVCDSCPLSSGCFLLGRAGKSYVLSSQANSLQSLENLDRFNES